MLTCPYCGSEIEVKDRDSFFCSFCELELSPNVIQQDGQRKPLQFHLFVSESWAARPTSRLMSLTSMELIYLLRITRRERSLRFNLMTVMKKGAEIDSSYISAANETAEEYEYWTRKVWSLENILRDRMIDFPTKITNNYLEMLYDRISTVNSKRMIVKRNNKENITTD